MSHSASPTPSLGKRVQVRASVRATGFDDLPDTFYVHSIPSRVKKLGSGDRILVSVGTVTNESLYAVTLGPVRVRGDAVVEFLGFSDSFIHRICYIQLPISRARVSKFAIVDCLRRVISFIDPIPARFVRHTEPLTLPPIMHGDGDHSEYDGAVTGIHIGEENVPDALS